MSAWLRRSLVNRIIDRSRAHREELDIDAVETDWHDDHWSVVPERVLERAEMRDELEDALARLPVVYRVAVVLHVRWAGPLPRSPRRHRPGCRPPSSAYGGDG